MFQLYMLIICMLWHCFSRFLLLSHMLLFWKSPNDHVIIWWRKTLLWNLLNEKQRQQSMLTITLLSWITKWGRRCAQLPHCLSLFLDTKLTLKQRVVIMEKLLKSGNLLATLVNDVFDLSRLENGSVQLDLTTINILRVFGEVKKEKRKKQLKRFWLICLILWHKLAITFVL